MTATEMIPAVGQTVQVRFESLVVNCSVADVKFSYGRPRLQVQPLSGYGLQWVEMSRVSRTTSHIEKKEPRPTKRFLSLVEAYERGELL